METKRNSIVLLLIVLVFAFLCGGMRMLVQKTDEPKVKIETSDIVAGNNKFAFELYGQLKDDPKTENMFFSPYSISTALAMVYAGARGRTEKQMAETLNSPKCLQEQFHDVFGQVQKKLNEQGEKGDYQLSVANALWAQKNYRFLREFIKLNDEYYKAGLENVDFTDAGEREKSRQMINAWVEEKTQEKIKNLIPKGVLDALTRLVLTNAIYFKGNWAEQFDKKLTSEQDFYVTKTKKVKAELMRKKDEFEFGQTKELMILHLPYKGDDLKMVVLLPKRKHELARIEKELTSENLAKWQKQVRKQEVDVYLPKFKMTSEFGLKPVLSKMGMAVAFGRAADFSGMDGTKFLYITAVLHKAFVEVNEEGTEAAAATGVVMGLRSIPTPPPVFRADHPFIFLIQDNSTGSILFAGRVMNPATKS